MTNIIYAQPHDSSLKDNLTKLSESMFGNGAQNEMHRQAALKGQRENTAHEGMADAIRGSNWREVLAQGARGGVSAQNAGGYVRGYVANEKGYDAPETLNASVGAGDHFGQTPQGVREGLAQQERAQKYASDRAASAQEAVAARTLVPVDGPDGGVTYRRTDQAQGAGVPTTVDRETAEAMRRYRQGGQTAGGQQQQMPGIVADKLKVHVGYWKDPRTGQVVWNGDGTAPAGFVPIKEDVASKSVQDERIRNKALEPPPQRPAEPGPGEKSAMATPGIVQGAQSHADSLIGALGGENLLNSIWGAKTLGPAKERVDQAQLNNEALTALSNFPGRAASNVSMARLHALLPQGEMVGGAEQGRIKSRALEEEILSQRKEAAAIAADLATPDAKRFEYQKHVDVLDRLLRRRYGIELPDTPQAGAPAAPTAAPATRAPVRVNTPEEAWDLAPGTPIIRPDGSPGVVPMKRPGVAPNGR